MQICNESLEWLAPRFALLPPCCIRQVWLALALLFLLAGCSTVTVRTSTQSEPKDLAARTIEWNSYASDFDHLNAPAQVKKFPTTLEEQLAGYRFWRDVEPDPELRPQLDLANTIKTWVTVCDYRHPFYERCLRRQRYPKWLIAPSENEIQEAARYFASRFSRTRGPAPPEYDLASGSWLDVCDTGHDGFSEMCHLVLQRQLYEKTADCLERRRAASSRTSAEPASEVFAKILEFLITGGFNSLDAIDPHKGRLACCFSASSTVFYQFMDQCPRSKFQLVSGFARYRPLAEGSAADQLRRCTWASDIVRKNSNVRVFELSDYYFVRTLINEGACVDEQRRQMELWVDAWQYLAPFEAAPRGRRERNR